jgi:hypothetical protein
VLALLDRAQAHTVTVLDDELRHADMITFQWMRHLLLVGCLLGVLGCSSKDKPAEKPTEEPTESPSEKPAATHVVTCDDAAMHLWEMRLADSEHPFPAALRDNPAKLEKLKQDEIAEFVKGCRGQATPDLACVMKATTRADLGSCR